MMIWEPFDPVSYFVHVIFGFTAFGAGILALVTTKGSNIHRKSGKVFGYFMVAVAVSSLVFMIYHLLPLAVVMSVAVLYLVPSGFNSINHKSEHALLYDKLLIVLPTLLFLFASIQAVRFQFIEGAPKIGPGLMALTFAFIIYQDIRAISKRRHHKNFWIRRHLTRMVLAFTFAAMALVRIGINFGLTIEQATIYPLLIGWLVVLYFFNRYPVAAVKHENLSEPV